MTEPSSAEHTDITIVGGGMVGATMALLLERCLPECAVTLVEARAMDDPSEEADSIPSSFDARSTAISPTTCGAFQRLGLWPSILADATPITHIHVTDKANPGQCSLSPEDNHGEPLGFVVGNRELGLVLTEALQRSGVRVIAPARVQALTMKRRGARLALDCGKALNTRLLVVADGANSPLRHRLGIGESSFDYEQHAVVANVSCSRPHNGCAYERFTRSGPLALLPWRHNEGRSCAMIWTWPTEQVHKAQQMSDQEFMAELQRVFGYRLGSFTGVSQRHYYPLSLRVAKEQVRSGVVLMGNAAHFLHPVAGQGFNLAVRDALRLVAVLQSAPADSLGALTVLKQYEKQQMADQDSTVLLSHGFNQVFRQGAPAVAGLRAAGFLALALAGPVRAQLVSRLSGRAGPQPQPEFGPTRCNNTAPGND